MTPEKIKELFLSFREGEITEWLKTKERGDIINRMVEEIIRS